jgi:integrase
MQRVWHRKSDGWWYATLKSFGVQKQIKLHHGPKNAAEREQAEELLIKKLADRFDANEPAVTVPRWLTVGHVITGFLAFSAGEHTPKTAEWYAWMLEGFKSAFGKLPIMELRKRHVLGFAKHKYDNPTSQNKAVVVIKRAFAWDFEEECIPRNPIAHVRKPNKSTPRDRVLEPHERELIINSIKDNAFANYFQALAMTGCRPGEIAKVTAADCQLDQGVWVLPEHKTAKKTGRPRTVYLTPEMLELTRKLVLKYPQGLIFRNYRGKPWSQNAIRCRFRRLRELHQELKGVVAYSLRHTFATDALERGVPDADVAALLGHSGTAVLHTWSSKLSQRRQHLRAAASRAVGVCQPCSLQKALEILFVNQDFAAFASLSKTDMRQPTLGAPQVDQTRRNVGVFSGFLNREASHWDFNSKGHLEN